jgi:hypothetical protein
MAFKTIRVAGVLTALVATAAQAQAPIVGFLNPNSGACFSRDYSTSHMRSHRKQRVSGIALIYTPMASFGGEPAQPQWDTQNDDPNFNATLAVKLVGQRRTYYQGVNCRSPGQGSIRCVIDEDGGAFTLTKTSTGLRLQNESGFTIAPRTGNERRDLAATVRIQPDAMHRTFLLTGGNGAACQRGWSLPR